MTETLMTCAGCDELFPAYFEGDLDPVRSAAIDAHVSSCVRCQGLVRDMTSLRDVAAGLPDLVPSRDLWGGIESRIQPSVVSIATQRRSSGLSRTWMAAAAAALVVVSSSVTYVGTTRVAAKARKPAVVKTAPPPRVADATGEAEPAVGAVPEAGREAGSEAVPASPALRSRESAAPARIRPAPRTSLASRAAQPVLTSSELAIADEISRLQQLLGEKRGQLEPGTVKVVEDNLAIIDAAVAQARAAVARDPASGFLAERLENALHKKVHLLRTVALLPSST